MGTIAISQEPPRAPLLRQRQARQDVPHRHRRGRVRHADRSTDREHGRQPGVVRPGQGLGGRPCRKGHCRERPDNPIKARWLGFHDSAGIHGTADEASIGGAASHGCIRMLIPDVIDLYRRVPLRTPRSPEPERGGARNDPQTRQGPQRPAVPVVASPPEQCGPVRPLFQQIVERRRPADCRRAHRVGEHGGRRVRVEERRRRRERGGDRRGRIRPGEQVDLAAMYWWARM